MPNSVEHTPTNFQDPHLAISEPIDSTFNFTNGKKEVLAKRIANTVVHNNSMK